MPKRQLPTANCQLPVVPDDTEIVDALAMALVDEIVSLDGVSDGVKAICRRMGIAARQRKEFLAAARMRLAGRADFDQDLERADAVTHYRSCIRRARKMGAADIADFEPFLREGKKLANLRGDGLDTMLVKEASEDITTKVDEDDEVTGVNIKRKIRLYSPIEAITLEMKARSQLAKIFALNRGAYDPPPGGGAGDGSIPDAEVLHRPRDPAAEELFDAIDKHLDKLKLTDGDATYPQVIAAAGKELRRLRREAKDQQPTANKKRPTSKAKATAKKKTAKKTKNKAKKARKGK